MTRLRSIWPLVVVATLWLDAASSFALANVQVYTNQAAWSAAAGDYTTIDFTGFPLGTIATTQYEDQGIVFTEGNDVITTSSAFVNDGYGLYANVAGSAFTISASLTEPCLSIAADHPGTIAFRLYAAGELFYESGQLGNGGLGFFSGLVSEEPFDSVIIFRWSGSPAFVDDLHFGSPIPAPSGLAFLGFAWVSIRRRRR